MQARPSRSAQFAALLALRARDMRAHPPDSARSLWLHLRRAQLGVRFRREVPIPNARCIADFLAPRERLVVEVDGPYHQRRLRADARRDERLRRAGYRVLRLSAELVQRDTSAALALIRAALAAKAPP